MKRSTEYKLAVLLLRVRDLWGVMMNLDYRSGSRTFMKVALGLAALSPWFLMLTWYLGGR